MIVNVNKHTLHVSIFSCTKPLRNISLAVIGVLLPLTILTNIIWKWMYNKTILDVDALVTISNASGKWIFVFCSQCGCHVFKRVGEDANYRATKFHIEDGIIPKLPKEFLPKVHIYYKTRHLGWKDDLPKSKYLTPEGLVDR